MFPKEPLTGVVTVGLAASVGVATEDSAVDRQFGDGSFESLSCAKVAIVLRHTNTIVKARLAAGWRMGLSVVANSFANGGPF